MGGGVPDAPRRLAAAEGSGGVKTPPYDAKDKRAVMARLRAGHTRPLRNMVMWDVGRPAPRPPGRCAAAEGGGGVKTPPYDANDKRVVMARLRAGRARPLRNMVMWDVGRPAPRPPGRFAAMRSLTDCRCRGRRPRRPAEVRGGGRQRAGHARPLRNMVMWDVGRPAPRPPGRFAAMRSLTDRRCRGRRPRRPAEVSGGGRRRRGQDPSLRCKG